jgi:hypothetical protein
VLKRIVIDLCVVTAFVLLVVGSIVGYVWLKDRPERAKRRAEAQEFIREEEAVYHGLESLGEIDLQPNQLTLADLEQRFHQPGLTQAGAEHSTRIGWACGKKRCALSFSFLIPTGQEVPPQASPAGILVSASSSHKVAIGGVRIGEPVEEMKEYCRTRGFGTETGFHRMTWDKDWVLMWGDWKDKVTFFSLVNQRQLNNSPWRITPRTEVTKP